MRDLAALITLYLAYPTSVSAFKILLPPRSSYPSPRGGFGSTKLDALARSTGSKSKKSSESSLSSSSFTAGFGRSNVDAAVVNRRTKVRSVSGNTPGSGTKVLANAANCFDRIRKQFGKQGTVDVYVRSPSNDEGTFWFVGKVVRVLESAAVVVDNESDKNGWNVQSLAGTVYPTISEAIISQKRLILEYAKNKLRPQNMGGPYSKNLELWYAPGDSEMDVVRNVVNLVKVVGSSRDLQDGFDVVDVGYNPEIYVGDEKEKGGLRVVRDAEGRPVKPVFEITV